MTYGGSEIHQLESANIDDNGDIIVKNIEAFRLTQWLERGVFDAIEKEYLKSLTFAIQTKHPITSEMLTVETYEFTIAYESTDGSTATINGVQLLSNDGLKAQAKRFLKTVYDFSSTLDDLPEERTLSMMLKYYSDCPPDYEPEFFHSAEGKSLDLHATTTTIKLGSVITPELNMHMTFNGLESLAFTDLARVGVSTDFFDDAESKLRMMSIKNSIMLCASAKNNFGEEVTVGGLGEDEIDINEDEVKISRDELGINKDKTNITKTELDINNEVVEFQKDVNRSSHNVGTQKEEDESLNKSVSLFERVLKYFNDNRGEHSTVDITKYFSSDAKKKEIQKLLTKLNKEGFIESQMSKLTKKKIWVMIETAENKYNMDISLGRTPVVKSQDQKHSQAPPLAPHKRDRLAAKAEIILEDKEIHDESRSIQSPDTSMKSQVSSDNVEVSHSFSIHLTFILTFIL